MFVGLKPEMYPILDYKSRKHFQEDFAWLVAKMPVANSITNREFCLSKTKIMGTISFLLKPNF